MITLDFCMKSRKPVLKLNSHNYLSGFESGTDMDGNNGPNEFNENACVNGEKGLKKHLIK